MSTQAAIPTNSVVRNWSYEKWIEKLQLQKEREELLLDLGSRRFDKRLEKNPIGGAAFRLISEATHDTAEVIHNALSKKRRGPRHIAEPWIKALDPSFKDACHKAALLVSQALIHSLGAYGGSIKSQTRRKSSTGPDGHLRDYVTNVSNLLISEVRYERLARLSPHLFEHKIRRFQEDHIHSYAFMSRSLDSAYRVAQCTECFSNGEQECSHLDPIKPPHQTRIHIGSFLIRSFLRATEEYTLSRGHKAGIFSVVVRKRAQPGKGMRVEDFLVAQRGAIQWLLDNNKRLALMDPERGPMVVPPLQWGQDDKRGGFRYRMNGRYPIFKKRSQRYDLPRQDSEILYSAVNRIQDTAWRINRDVYDLIPALRNAASRQKLTVAGVPSAEPYPEGLRYPFKEKWRDLSKEERRKDSDYVAYERANYLEGRRKTLEAKRIDDLRDFDMTMRIADRHVEDEAFWFVWQCDSRGRLYPLSDYLQPQGTDVDKSLLTFADARPMGPEGGTWLAIHLANCMKKTPEGRRVSEMAFTERETWVHDHEVLIAHVGQHPFGDDAHGDELIREQYGVEPDWWTECGDPLRFFAACCEWLRWVDSDYSEEFESSLPVSMDGSNNGVQHFAAAWRDPEVAYLVNVTPNKEPRDLYGELAKLVNDRLAEEAVGVAYGGELWYENGQMAARLKAELAKRWLDSGWVDRALVKRPGMTIGYGAERFGFQRQIVDHLAGEGLIERAKTAFQLETAEQNIRTQVRSACRYLGDVIWAALEDLVPSVFEYRRWLRECATLLSKQNVAAEWVVPQSGVCVRQLYYRSQKKRVKTRISGQIVMPEAYTETDKIEAMKQVRSTPPNWIHSLDAAALMLTVHRCAALGLESFSMNHDSFGVPAGDASVMAHTLRQEFYRLYGESDPVRELYEQLQAQSPEESLPEPPAKGDLDVSLVLASEYFFA